MNHLKEEIFVQRNLHTLCEKIFIFEFFLFLIVYSNFILHKYVEFNNKWNVELLI